MVLSFLDSFRLMSDDTPLGSMAHLFIPKLRLTNPLVVACYFISICLLQTIANDFSTFISVNPNMGNTSSLMCRKEQCRSAVHLAIQCHRKAGCLGWIYDDIINMPCLLCQCPTHPYHFNRHSLALQSVLNVFDTPRIEKGMQTNSFISFVYFNLTYTHIYTSWSGFLKQIIEG